MKYFFNTDGTLKTGWVGYGDRWRFYSGNNMVTGWRDIGTNVHNKTCCFTPDGIMVSGKWLRIDGKWYYFYSDGALAKNALVGNGVRKTKQEGKGYTTQASVCGVYPFFILGKVIPQSVFYGSGCQNAAAGKKKHIY